MYLRSQSLRMSPSLLSPPPSLTTGEEDEELLLLLDAMAAVAQSSYFRAVAESKRL